MDGRGNVISELCGEGFRDIRGLISCKGCGLKFRSGAEFGKHAKYVEERKKNRLELAEQVAFRGREAGGKKRSVLYDVNAKREKAGSGVSKQSTAQTTSMKEDATTRVRMPGSAIVGMPGGYCVTNKLDQRQVTSSTDINMSKYDGEVLPVQENSQSQGHIMKKEIQEPSVSGMLESGRVHLPISMTGHQEFGLSAANYVSSEMSSGPGLGHNHKQSNVPYSTNASTFQATQHPVITEQILQQQQLAFQQLSFQQQQQHQLHILRQQHQQAATCFPASALPQQQQIINDRDRQIALLEKELLVQRMMIEVEKREAMLREQTTLLSAQAERIRQEQLQVQRYYAPVGAGCISQENVGIGSQGDIKNESTDIQINEKAKLERMFLMMEKARKEELEKLAVEKWDKKVEEEVDKINTGAVRKKTASSTEVRPVSVVNIGMIEDDVFTRNPNNQAFPFDDSDTVEVDDAAEQQKILEEIKTKNEERARQEELTMKLITKLSMDESEELAPRDLSESWPSLSETAGEGETVREKIQRLKKIAERNGMCVRTMGPGNHQKSQKR